MVNSRAQEIVYSAEYNLYKLKGVMIIGLCKPNQTYI